MIASFGPASSRPIRMPRSRARHAASTHAPWPPARRPPYHRPVHNSPEARSTHRGAAARLGGAPSPRARRVAPMDAAEAFRDLPGLALLESARPGPDRPLELPDRRPRRGGRRAVGRARTRSPRPGRCWRGSATRSGRRRPRAGRCRRSRAGWSGYLGYDLGRRFERLPSIARVDQHLPVLRLGAPRLGDRLGPADRARHGSAARAVDGDAGGGSRRAGRRRCGERLEALARGSARRARRTPLTAPTSFALAGRRTRAWIGDVEAVREAIGRGDIYQANLTRRLEAPFDGDPWPSSAACGPATRPCSPAILDLGPVARRAGAPRALLSASPEPFLSVDAEGHVIDRSDQGHAAARPDPRAGPRARPRAAWPAPRTRPRT